MNFLNQLFQQIKKFFSSLFQSKGSANQISQPKQVKVSPMTDKPVTVLLAYQHRDYKVLSSHQKKEYLKKYNALHYVKQLKHDYYLQNKDLIYQRKKLKRSLIKLVKVLQEFLDKVIINN
jgi:hypothetical protein